jgi:hypothetical protein
MLSSSLSSMKSGFLMIVPIYAKVSDKRYAKLAIYRVEWVDGEGLLPSVAVCLV